MHFGLHYVEQVIHILLLLLDGLLQLRQIGFHEVDLLLVVLGGFCSALLHRRCGLSQRRAYKQRLRGRADLLDIIAGPNINDHAFWITEFPGHVKRVC